MAKNDNLHKAKTAKNDEFYTQLTDIEKELKHYRNHFRDKTVFCNCDDPMESNFWQYFSLNFDRLGLRRLIATHFDPTAPSYMLEMWRDDAGVHTDIKRLKENGDFRSPECIELLKQADIVCTNEPFSLARQYIAQLMEYDKKFVIICTMNSITYKEVFPLLKDGKMWIGYTHPKTFLRPDGTEQTLGNILWYTNLDIKKRHEPLVLCKKYDPELYPRYDNYDAINVDKVADIPMDYCESWGVPAADAELLDTAAWETVRRDKDGYVWLIPAEGTELRRQMHEREDGYKERIEAALNTALYCNGEFGVPITFLDSHSPEQFDVVRFRKGDDGKDLCYTLADNSSFVNVERERERAEQGAAVLQNRHPENRLKYCNGVMGVPITFLDAFSPEQFMMFGIMNTGEQNPGLRYPNTPHGRPVVMGREIYLRILVRCIATARWAFR